MRSRVFSILPLMGAKKPIQSAQSEQASRGEQACCQNGVWHDPRTSRNSVASVALHPSNAHRLSQMRGVACSRQIEILVDELNRSRKTAPGPLHVCRFLTAGPVLRQ